MYHGSWTAALSTTIRGFAWYFSWRPSAGICCPSTLGPSWEKKESFYKPPLPERSFIANIYDVLGKCVLAAYLVEHFLLGFQNPLIFFFSNLVAVPSKRQDKVSKRQVAEKRFNARACQLTTFEQGKSPTYLLHNFFVHLLVSAGLTENQKISCNNVTAENGNFLGGLTSSGGFAGNVWGRDSRIKCSVDGKQLIQKAVLRLLSPLRSALAKSLLNFMPYTAPWYIQKANRVENEGG